MRLRSVACLTKEQREQLPGGVFNRGFIRSVARYLGLDEDSLVAEYALETRGRTEPGVVADPPEEPQRDWARISVVVVLALLILAGGWAAIHYLGPKIAARLHKHSGEPVNSAPGPAVAPTFAARDSQKTSASESSAIGPELNGQPVPAGGQPGQPSNVTLTQKDLKSAGGDAH